MLIRRGRRVADYLDSSCTALFVARDSAMSELSVEDRAISLVKTYYRYGGLVGALHKKIQPPNICQVYQRR